MSAIEDGMLWLWGEWAFGGPVSLSAKTPIPRAAPPAPESEPKESLTTQKGRPLVCLQVNGKTTVCFLDTGSEVTIVKEAHVNMLPGVRLLQTSRSLQGVSGPPSPVVAEADLTFRLHSDFVLTHRTCVATVVYFPGDVLLGMDLLHCLSFRLVHSPASSLLEVDGHYHQITYTGEESKCVHEAPGGEVNDKCGKEFQHISPVHVAERIVIPAQSGCFVPANLTRGMPPDAHLAIVEGNATCLTVPRTLISVHERRSSVWVVNTDQRARKLSPGTILGYAEIVQLEEVTRADDHDTQGSGLSDASNKNLCSATTGGQDRGTFNAVPPACNIDCDSQDGFIDDEYDGDGCLDFSYDAQDFFIFPETPALDEALQRETLTETPHPSAAATCTLQDTDSHSFPDVAMEHLTSDMKRLLTELLKGFPRLFSGDEMTVGEVPGIEHRIRTTTDTPICTRQWRLPVSTKEIIRGECDRMLAQGVIEPSSSPWLSPVVLVRKKDGTHRFCVDY